MECDKKTQSAIKPSTVEVAQIIKRWRKKEKLKKKNSRSSQNWNRKRNQTLKLMRAIIEFGCFNATVTGNPKAKPKIISWWTFIIVVLFCQFFSLFQALGLWSSITSLSFIPPLSYSHVPLYRLGIILQSTPFSCGFYFRFVVLSKRYHSLIACGSSSGN